MSATANILQWLHRKQQQHSGSHIFPRFIEGVPTSEPGPPIFALAMKLNTVCVSKKSCPSSYTESLYSNVRKTRSLTIILQN